jgi:hypothetical protein
VTLRLDRDQHEGPAGVGQEIVDECLVDLDADVAHLRGLHRRPDHEGEGHRDDHGREPAPDD